MRTKLPAQMLSWMALMAILFGFTTPTAKTNLTAAARSNAAKSIAVMSSCDPGDPAFVDSDGDGVGNDCDLDDDNDGILDTNEMTFNGYLNTSCENNLIERIGFTTAFTLNTQLMPSIGLIVGTDATFTTGFPMGLTCSEISFGTSLPTFTTDIYFKFVTPGNAAVPVPLDGMTMTSDCAGANELPFYDAYDINGNFLYTESLISTPYGANQCVNIKPAANVDVYSIRVRQVTSAARLTGLSLRGISPYGDRDTDNDGTPDRLDQDSDNDGCNDVVEAGGMDGDANGVLGTSPVQVDANGQVTGQGGYTGNVANVTKATRLLVNTPPTGQSAESGDNVSFTVASAATSTTAYTGSTPNYTDPSATDVSAAIAYQWQEDTGSGFANIINGGIYSGVTTATLTLTGVPFAKNGAVYRVLMSHPDNACIVEQRQATLTVIQNPCNPLDPGFVDTDLDGVGNACDLDDDNDGILDTNECSASTFFWSSAPVVSGSTATGTINGIAYTYTSSQPVGATTTMFGHANFPVSYGVPNLNPTIRNDFVTNNTLTFASPIINPVLVFASIGAANRSVGIDFGAPVEILWSKAVVQNTPTRITGTEGYAIVRMTGTFSSISFNYTVAETWVNFAFGATLPIVCDLDADGNPNSLDLDSDNDGCPDAVEAGGSDGDGNGVLGTGAIVVDGNGKVIGQGSYTSDFADAYTATRLLVNTPPTDQSVESGDNVSFTVASVATSTTAYTGSTPNYTDPSATNVSAAIAYQWQEDTGSGFVNIINGGIYAGSTTSTLTLSGVPLVKNGAIYRVLITHPDNACIAQQRQATLTVTGCLMDVGGTVFDDPTGITDGLSGSPVNGATLGLYMTLITSAAGGPTQVVTPVTAAGTFQFTNVPAGSHRLVLGTTATGSTVGQMPAGYFALAEGGAIVSGTGTSDGDGDGELGLTADCAGIVYETARVAADVSYLDNNFVISVEDPLPVTLISFTLAKEETNVRLNWKTSAEMGSDQFEIQRSSDGKKWMALGAVKAKGESSVNEFYTYLDQEARSGSNFYRLKMIDRDGTFAYSSIKSISINGKEMIIAYPNPTEGPMQLKLSNWTRVKSVVCIDMNGKKVFETGRPNSEILALPALGKGLNVLTIQYVDGTREALRVMRP